MILEPHRVVNPPYLGLSKYHIFDIQKGQILAAQSAFSHGDINKYLPDQKGFSSWHWKIPKFPRMISHYKVVPQFVS